MVGRRRGSTSVTSSSPFSWARTAISLATVLISSRIEKGWGSKSSMPASILEKSRMSLRICSRVSAERETMLRYSRCTGVSSLCRASRVSPMMPFMGVRISCDMLARKLLLALDASRA